MSAQWYLLGLQLKVKIGTLESIQAQFADPKCQLLEMLKTWLTTSDSITWKALTNALRSQSVGASQLAGVLEKKYCQVKGTDVDKGMSALTAGATSFLLQCLCMYLCSLCNQTLTSESLVMQDKYP